MQKNIQKNETSMRTNIRRDIEYNRNILSEFKFLFSQHIEICHNDVQDKRVRMTEETSNYSTRFYNKVEESIPLYKQLENDLENPFKLFVMGPGNYGKSTLINSLLGTKEKHAKEGRRPITWKIDIFEKNNEENKVTIVYKNGREQVSTYEEAEDIITKEESKTKSSMLKNKYSIDKIIIEKNLNKEEADELRLKTERENVYYSDIVEVRWGIQDAELLDDFNIVDTPGLGQNNFSGEVGNSVNDYYHKSDGVIWLLDAHTISAKNTNDLLKKLDESLEKMGGKKATNQMIAVLNRIDLVNHVEGQKEEVVKEAYKIFGERFKKIIPYSATQAYKSVIEKDEELKISSGRLELLEEINSSFMKNAEQIQSYKKTQSFNVYNQALKNEINSYITQLNKDGSKYRESVNMLINHSFLDFSKLMEQFSNDLLSEYQNFQIGLENKLMETTKLSKHEQDSFLRNTVFNVTHLEKKYKYYANKAHKLASDKAYQKVKELQFTQYTSLAKYKDLKIILPEYKSHYTQKKLDISMPSIAGASIGGAGLGFLFGPLTGLVGLGLGALYSSGEREETIKKVTSRYQSIISEMEDKFYNIIESVYQEMLYEALLQINSSYKDLYSFRTIHTEELINVTNYLLELCEKAVQELSESN